MRATIADITSASQFPSVIVAQLIFAAHAWERLRVRDVLQDDCGSWLMRLVNFSFCQPGEHGVAEGIVSSVEQMDDGNSMIVMSVDGPEEMAGSTIWIRACRFNRAPSLGDDIVYDKINDVGVLCRKISEEPEALWEFEEYNKRMFGGLRP